VPLLPLRIKTSGAKPGMSGCYSNALLQLFFQNALWAGARAPFKQPFGLVPRAAYMVRLQHWKLTFLHLLLIVHFTIFIILLVNVIVDCLLLILVTLHALDTAPDSAFEDIFIWVLHLDGTV